MITDGVLAETESTEPDMARRFTALPVKHALKGLAGRMPWLYLG